ncbi:hypothetical protein [Streptomyces sp. NPDC056144]|uniref:hypothetical protein n=1 Tax=unclassified Streptomyces TaxID=2593676 RepID=UPI0035D93310
MTPTPPHDTEARLRAALAARAAQVTHHDLRRQPPPTGRARGIRSAYGRGLAVLAVAATVAAVCLLTLLPGAPLAPTPVSPAGPPPVTDPTPSPNDPALPAPKVQTPGPAAPTPTR